MATLTISDIEVRGVLGILKDERQFPQTLTVDVKIETCIDKPARSGAITDAIDYSATYCLCRFLLEWGRFYLIESLIHTLSLALLKVNTHAKEITITIGKPDALPENADVKLTYSLMREKVLIDMKKDAFYSGRDCIVGRGLNALKRRLIKHPTAAWLDTEGQLGSGYFAKSNVMDVDSVENQKVWWIVWPETNTPDSTSTGFKYVSWNARSYI